MTITQEQFETNRMNGIGSNFSVIEPVDGFRKDNRLWFGKCSVCGEQVTNSALVGYWEHTIYLVRGSFSKDRFDSGIYNHTQSRGVDYCPTAKGENHPCKYYYEENGEKIFV